LPREIWVMVGAALLVALGYGVVSPVLPRFAISFDVSVTAANVVVSVFAFFRLVFAPTAGRLISALGERPMYISGMLVVAASSFASAFAHSYWQLLVYRGVGGVGSVTFTVAATSLIIKNAPRGAQGRASAAYGGGFLLGGIAGPAVGSLLAPLGMRAPFIIYAVTLVLAALLVAILTPAQQRPATGSGDVAQRERADLRTTLALPLYRRLLFASFANGWTNLGVRVSLVPLLAAALAGAPEWLPGAALTVYAAGNAISLLMAGRIADRRGRAAAISFGLVVSGLFSVMLGWLPWQAMLVCCVFAGLGAGFIQPGMQGQMADILDGREGGRVIAAFQMAGDVGQIAGPVVAGWLVDISGYGLAFAFAGSLLLLASGPWLRMNFSSRGA